ncbi:hypothetical protein M3Y99_00697200 [Aphelenchoides fujianensis]|nr:hypothetical protein M3Y99_00697200 [Aphelenchoides fujianensis]
MLELLEWTDEVLDETLLAGPDRFVARVDDGGRSIVALDRRDLGTLHVYSLDERRWTTERLDDRKLRTANTMPVFHSSHSFFLKTFTRCAIPTTKALFRLNLAALGELPHGPHCCAETPSHRRTYHRQTGQKFRKNFVASRARLLLAVHSKLSVEEGGERDVRDADRHFRRQLQPPAALRGQAVERVKERTKWKSPLVCSATGSSRARIPTATTNPAASLPTTGTRSSPL